MAIAEANPSKRLGNFEVLREIGQGGMGVVYLARQPALERLVVLKKIRREMLIDPSIVERFQREARAAAAVHHQNVVAVYDCFQARGDYYIAQELVSGADLSAILQKVGRLDSRIAALIALEIVRGLEEIHARGVVHRDLKPANILIGSGGEVKIADFGIALEGTAPGLTRPGTMVGSVPYMSPEQMLGEPVDYRSDLFSFGILFYEMLVGAPPFQESGDDATETLLSRMRAGRFDSPRSRGAKVPGSLWRLIRGCLRGKPSRRAQSATVVRRRLERRIAAVSPSDCRREIATYLWQKGVVKASAGGTSIQAAVRLTRRSLGRRSRLWLAAAVGAAVLAVVVARGALLSFLRAPHAGDEARASAGAAPVPGVPAPAYLRFVAYPWAEISLDDGTRFFTPRTEPAEVEPGRHTVAFEHPRFGRAEYTIEVRGGEHRTVKHVFEEARRQ